MAERLKPLDSGSREPGSIPVSDLLVVVFSALPTRKSTLTDNEHSRSCGRPYTQKKAVPLVVQRVKRQKKLYTKMKLVAISHAQALLNLTQARQCHLLLTKRRSAASMVIT